MKSIIAIVLLLAGFSQAHAESLTVLSSVNNQAIAKRLFESGTLQKGNVVENNTFGEAVYEISKFDSFTCYKLVLVNGFTALTTFSKFRCSQETNVNLR